MNLLKLLVNTEKLFASPIPRVKNMIEWGLSVCVNCPVQEE
jgi:hypothetical protein